MNLCRHWTPILNSQTWPATPEENHLKAPFSLTMHLKVTSYKYFPRVWNSKIMSLLFLYFSQPILSFLAPKGAVIPKWLPLQPMDFRQLSVSWGEGPSFTMVSSGGGPVAGLAGVTYDTFATASCWPLRIGLSITLFDGSVGVFFQRKHCKKAVLM